MRPTIVAQALLTPAEVAELFRVDPKPVTRWAKAGWLTKTLGGHGPYRQLEVERLLERMTIEATEDVAL